MLSDKLCECGCGERTALASKNDSSKCHVKGEPLRFLPFHRVRNLSKPGPLHAHWKGGRGIMTNGYVWIYAPHHPKAKCGMIYEHVLIAEKALGRHMPKGAQVHHWNEIESDNRNTNLVICQDIGYHKLLHKRMREMKRL